MKNYTEQKCKRIILCQSCLFLAAVLLGIIVSIVTVSIRNMNPKTAMIACLVTWIVILTFGVWAFLAPAIYCFVKMRSAKKVEWRSEHVFAIVSNWSRSSWRKELSKVSVNIDGKEYFTDDCFYYNEASKIVGKQVECFLNNGKAVIVKVIK